MTIRYPICHAILFPHVCYVSQSYHIRPAKSRWNLSPVAWIAGGLGAFVKAIEYAGGGKGWEVSNQTNGGFSMAIQFMQFFMRVFWD